MATFESQTRRMLSKLKEHAYVEFERQANERLRKANVNLANFLCPEHGPGRFTASIRKDGPKSFRLVVSDGCCQAGAKLAAEHARAQL